MIVSTSQIIIIIIIAILNWRNSWLGLNFWNWWQKLICFLICKFWLNEHILMQWRVILIQKAIIVQGIGFYSLWSKVQRIENNVRFAALDLPGYLLLISLLLSVRRNKVTISIAIISRSFQSCLFSVWIQNSLPFNLFEDPRLERVDVEVIVFILLGNFSSWRG